MRRGVGVAGLQNAARAREQFKNVGDEVRKQNLQAMQDQMALFKSKLEEFALQHKSDIRRDPEFRAQFHQMCANIGVDPLSSNKGVWAKTLGFGDFYYELAVQVVEACWATRNANGGLFELAALTRAVNKRRGSRADSVTVDDVVRAIKKLRVLGEGFDVVTIGAVQYVRSVPGELNLDKNNVLQLAQVAAHRIQTELYATCGEHDICWGVLESQRLAFASVQSRHASASGKVVTGIQAGGKAGSPGLPCAAAEPAVAGIQDRTALSVIELSFSRQQHLQEAPMVRTQAGKRGERREGARKVYRIDTGIQNE